ALMGSNLQRQAVPLMKTERPRVGTGLERRAAVDSGMGITTQEDGAVEYVGGDELRIRDNAGRLQHCKLIKFMRINQDTCLNQKPLVDVGTKVEKGDPIADGASTDAGELALGKNVLVGFMPWEGYNFEDAILISDRLVHDDVFTSIHIEKLEI